MDPDLSTGPGPDLGLEPVRKWDETEPADRTLGLVKLVGLGLTNLTSLSGPQQN